MRSAKEYVCAALTTSSGLAALVGERIYYQGPEEVPVYPLITYREVGGTADKADGINYMGRSRIEIKIWGKNGLEDIADEVMAAMNICRGGPTLASSIDLPRDSASLVKGKALDFNLIVKL